jgi:hypothetical protein
MKCESTTRQNEKNYEKLITDVAGEIVEQLEQSALRLAWSGTPIPTFEWEKITAEEISSLVQDILAVERRERLTWYNLIIPRWLQ